MNKEEIEQKIKELREQIAASDDFELNEVLRNDILVFRAILQRKF